MGAVYRTNETMEEAPKTTTENMSEMREAMDICTDKLKVVDEWTNTTRRLCESFKEDHFRLGEIHNRIDQMEMAKRAEMKTIQKCLQDVAGKQNIIKSQ